jgi:hypothetical protein
VDGFFISCKETHLYGQETGGNRLLASSMVQSCTDSFKLNFQILFFLRVWGPEVLIRFFFKRWQELCLSIKIGKRVYTQYEKKTKKGGHFPSWGPRSVDIYG